MYDLEIALSTERVNIKLDYIAERLPALSLKKIAMTRYFAVFGCDLPSPLSSNEKMLLEALVDQQVIYRFRCGKQR